MIVRILLAAAGSFTLVLGVLHFTVPALLDFRSVILDRPAGWKPQRPFRLWLTSYVVGLRDRYGVVWVMNHAASYTLISIGLMDLLAAGWLTTPAGRILALWIAGFWLLRAGTQLTFGRRTGDWLILAWFAALGLLHLAVAAAIGAAY